MSISDESCQRLLFKQTKFHAGAASMKELKGEPCDTKRLTTQPRSCIELATTCNYAVRYFGIEHADDVDYSSLGYYTKSFLYTLKKANSSKHKSSKVLSQVCYQEYGVALHYLESSSRSWIYCFVFKDA